MKLKMKRIASVGLAVVMSLSLMACGSKSTSSSAKSEDNNEILKKVVEASKDVKSVEGTSEFDFKLSAAGQEMMSMSGEAVIKSTTEPQNIYTKLTATMSSMGKTQDMNSETYEVVNGDKAEVYENTDGEWKYNEVDMSEYSDMIEEFKSSLDDFDYDKITDYVDKVTTKKDGNEYSIVIEASLKNIFDELEKTELSDKLSALGTTEIPDMKIVVTMTADAETCLLKSMSVKLDSDKFEIQGIECSIDSFKFETNIENYDDVEITVPDDVLAAKDK